MILRTSLLCVWLMSFFRYSALFICLSILGASLDAADPIRIALLGDHGHHRPSDFFRSIQAPLAKRGIELTYHDDVPATLRRETLSQFDGLMIYANIERIAPEQEKALLDYVREGGAFLPIHCASYCFLNSPAYVELVGAQFKEHGGERFATQIIEPQHEIMKGFGGFESWDETYVHTRHNPKDRVVLEERREGRLAKDTHAEPWTWIRNEGSGRVFYTAWGHNLDTWRQAGFVNLLERGIRWATKRSVASVEAFSDNKRFPAPTMKSLPPVDPPYSFTDVGNKIPNYTPGERWGVQGKPLNLMQTPLAAKDSVKRYSTPEDFEIKIWASERNRSQSAASDEKYAGLEGKPLAMNWDHRGRLWLCETIDYPNELQPLGKGRDRIRICEDTDKDGVADRFTVFASGLSIPTAIVPCRGGIIVQDGTQTVFLKDVDGDDRADMRQLLITGWAMGDTHGGVSNFQYGLDNWIWAMQGYNDSQPVINGEPQQRFRQGFWRFAVSAGVSDDTAPVYAIKEGVVDASQRTKEFDSHSIRVSALEFIRSTNNNTWGFGQSEDGLIFGSTANNNPSCFMPIPNRYYERVKGWSPEVLRPIADNPFFRAITSKVRQVDQFGAYTAGAGHALYTARNYPRSWWNRVAFVCEPTGHLVGTFVLNPEGAGYQSTSPFNLTASDDEWAAPTMAEVGPDGNVWIIDWYNFIVQHNPTPQGFTTGKGNAYESDLRDKKHGRIYRVVYSGTDGESRETIERSNGQVANGLDANQEMQLVATLSHPNLLWRKHAQRLLIEKGQLAEATFSALEAAVRDQTTDALGLNPGATHAAWVLSAYKRPVSVQLAVNHPSPAVRRNLIMAAENTETTAGIVAKEFIADSNPQVQLAALLKLSDIAQDDKLAQGLVRPSLLASTDKWILDGWTSAASIHWKQVLPLLVRISDPLSRDFLDRFEIVAEHAARSRVDAPMLESLLVSPRNVDASLAIMQGLAKGWPKDHLLDLPTASGQRIANDWLKGALPIEAKSQVLQLANVVGIQGISDGLGDIVSELLAAAADTQKEMKSRASAAKQAILLNPESVDSVKQLLAMLGPQSPPEWSDGVLDSVSGSRINSLGEALLSRSKNMPPDFLKKSIRVLMARPQTTRELLDLMESNRVTLADLQLDQKQTLREHPDEAIRQRAKELMQSKGLSLNTDRQKVVESWMDLTKQAGDAGHGKEMFQKHCALCHVHGEMGVQIGPNLTGMAVHPKAELLVHILDPSRSVEGNFRSYTVRTTDDAILTGMLASESKTSIELVNAQAKREVILREDIAELLASQKSLMPEGFEGQMSRDDMKDLLEFLTSKGKYVPLSIDSIATTITSQGMFFEPSGTAERLAFRDWSPKTYKGVPFVLIDPQRNRVPNAVMLYGPNGKMAPKMPKQVEITCETPVVAIHMLSGVGGWSYPASREGSVSMIVRLTFSGGTTEEHPLINGQHFADYIRRVDVPKSEFAFDLQGRQLRYIELRPKTRDLLTKIELIKGSDISAPIVMAMTVQTTE